MMMMIKTCRALGTEASTSHSMRNNKFAGILYTTKPHLTSVH
jgi:hypothetical protein